MGLKITGRKAHAARLRYMAGSDMKTEIGRALYVAGDKIKVIAAISITAGSVSGKGHAPSKPGDPPNADTRFLDTHIITDQPETLRVRVISQAPYSVPLEYGTAKMAARPYMRPAAAKGRPIAVAIVVAAVQKVVSRARLQTVTNG